MTRVSIEGNIGAGKSRFLEMLEERYGSQVQILYEPVDQWKDCEGHNILKLFYENGPKTAYMFQTYLLSTRLGQQMDCIDDRVAIIERSGKSDVCFARMSLESGFLTDVEYVAYMNLYRTMMRLMPETTKIVYLRVSPNVCMERIHNRGRPEEAGISLEYLTRIHDLHDTWLIDDEKPAWMPVESAEVLVVNHDGGWESCPDLEAKLAEIGRFMGVMKDN
jgi:deoxyadenosine/deoxycytidine kinase